MDLIIKRFEELTTDELYELLKIRVDIFVVEQKCPYQELDEKDKRSYHIYLKEKYWTFARCFCFKSRRRV